MDKTERAINLEAKVKSSMKYPLRPPLFTLGLYSAPPGENSYEMNDSEWFNELHAVEAEVNLHIRKILPCDYENYIVAHQCVVLRCCLTYSLMRHPHFLRGRVLLWLMLVCASQLVE